MTEEFALAWTTSKNSPDNSWIMVLHTERGWELPGGAISEGDSQKIIHSTISPRSPCDSIR